MPSTGKIKIILFLSIVFLLAGLSVFFIPAPEPAKGLSNDKYLAASCTAQYYCYRNQWRYRNRSCNVFLLATCASGCCTASGCKSATSSNWSGWTDTSACSGTCGGGTGTKTQSRTCQGAVSCGGTNNCTGPSTQTVSCTNNSCCSVNGGWTATACGNWSTCTRSCGTGTQSRTCSRTCTNPSPSCNGANCSGSSSWSESQYCNTQSCCTDNGSTCNYSDSCDTTGNNNCGTQVSRCNRTTAVAGGWSTWSYGAWTNSGSCGQYQSCKQKQTQSGSRTCNNPAPACGGAACSGPSTSSSDRYADCGLTNGAWTGCSTSCGTGVQICTGASCGGTCSGSAPSCTAGVVNGGWSTWSYGAWTNSGSCGQYQSCKQKQTQSGSRTCNNPAPACGGAACSGPSTSSSDRYVDCGLTNGGWSTWSYGAWTNSGSCGQYQSCKQKQTQSGSRTCNNPAPACGGAACSGPSTSSSDRYADCGLTNGGCGSRTTTYQSTDSAWPAGSAYCSSGNASASAAFPAQGASSSWNCTGACSGANASCTADRRLVTPAVTVAPNPVARGGNVTFSWGAIANATYYNIQYRRDGAWGAWFNLGNVTSRIYSAAGLSVDVAARVQACSAVICSNISSQATATIAPVPTATISASPASIGFNTSAQLIWSSTNASTCAVTGNGSTWTGTSRPAPGQSTGNLTATQTYTITCNGQAGQVATNAVTINVAAPTVSISSLTMSPVSGAGTAPLNVSFTIGVGGSAIGSIHYQIDCTNNSSYEFDVSTSANPYTAANACNYPIGGSYTPRVKVTRSSVSATQTPNYSVIFTLVTADIKAQFGASPASDGPINVPVGGNFILSWTTTGGTSCKTTGGGSWQANVSLALAGNPLSGSMTRTMGSSSETYPMSCTIPGGGTTPDTVTVNPIPLAPANFRITSAAPYIKGNAISFAWDSALAASYYMVTFFGNGAAITPPAMPSPASAAAISYSNTAGLNSLGAAVAACRSAGVCGPATAIVTANLIAPTPSNTAPTVISTTNNSGTGYASNLSTVNDVKYAQVPVSATDQVYRLQTSGSATPTMSIVDANGNNIVPAATTDIQLSGNTAVFKVPANAAYFIKFTGTSGNFTYGFQRYRNVPYYQGL